VRVDGAAVAWPLAARAQQPERMRRIGVLVNLPADGFVESLAHPGGNTTGFTNLEYGVSGKWLELLKQLAPRVTRAAVLRDSTVSSGTAQFAAIQAVAPSLGVEVSPVNVRNASEIERGVAAFARSANDGLIVTTSTLANVHRDLIGTNYPRSTAHATSSSAAA
jgi:ABC-type uncharacterized transport system substrate-binding protein